jgi:ATP-binding cassette, subfamily B, bacterial
VRGLLRLLNLDVMVLNRAAVGAFYQAAPKLTAASIALAILSGLLVPAFALATGGLVEATRTGTNVQLALLMVGVLFAVQRTIDPLREELGHELWPRVDHWLNDRIMRAVSRSAGLQQLEDPKVLDKIAQARGAVTGFTLGRASELFSSLLQQRIQALTSLVVIGRWYWWAAIGLLVVYAISFNITRWHFLGVTEVMYGRTERFRRAYYLRSLALSSTVAKETRVFHLTDWLVRSYRGSSLAIFNEVWQRRNEGWLIALGTILLLVAVELFTAGYVVNDAVQGVRGLDVAVAVVFSLITAGSLNRYDELDWGMSDAAESVRKVKELEAATDHSWGVDSGTRTAEGLPRKLIRFENVSFRYPGRDTPVLDGFNLDVEAGKSLAIVGQNGAGKTTLVKLITRLYDPTSGRITVDGIDLREIEPTAWHRRVSALFQDFARFEMSAYDNVAFGALHLSHDAQAVQRAAEQAGVAHVVERLSDGWQTRLSREFRNGAELSGGEWQRLALARALFGVSAGAGVLILDEPTASMDVRGEAEVYQRFLELTRGVTTIVISHRFSTVQRADRIVVVEHGRVIEDGTHAQLLALPGGRYAEMFTLQASRFSGDDVEEEEEEDELVDA